MSVCNDYDYNQGDVGGTMMFQLYCTNTPVGTVVSLTSSNPEGCNPPIYIPPTKVTNSQGFIVGMTSEVQADYTSVLTCCYDLPPGVTPPPGFSITLRVLFEVSGDVPTGSKNSPTYYHLKFSATVAE